MNKSALLSHLVGSAQLLLRFFFFNNIVRWGKQINTTQETH